MSEAKITGLPPNPFYELRYATSIKGGQAWIVIPAPGGTVAKPDAQDVLDLMALIARRLKRDIESEIQ